MATGQQRRKFTPEFKNEAVRLVIDSGRPVAQVARDIGVVEGTLGNWVNLWRAEHVGEEPALSISERAELAQLRRDNQTLRMEREFLKKAAAFFATEQNRVSKYRLVQAEKANFPIVMMCRLLGIGRSAYYAWVDRVTLKNCGHGAWCPAKPARTVLQGPYEGASPVLADSGARLSYGAQ